MLDETSEKILNVVLDLSSSPGAYRYVSVYEIAREADVLDDFVDIICDYLYAEGYLSATKDDNEKVYRPKQMAFLYEQTKKSELHKTKKRKIREIITIVLAAIGALGALAQALQFFYGS